MKLVTATAAVATALAATATVATGTAVAAGLFDGTNGAGRVAACFQTGTGQLRVLDTRAGAVCRKDEKPLDWSVGASTTPRPLAQASSSAPVTAPMHISGTSGSFTPAASVQVVVPEGTTRLVRVDFAALASIGSYGCRGDFGEDSYSGHDFRINGERIGFLAAGTGEGPKTAPYNYQYTYRHGGTVIRALKAGTHTLAIGLASSGCTGEIVDGTAQTMTDAYLAVHPSADF